MAYTRIYIHFVFGTKKRYPFLEGPKKKILLDQIRENANLKGIQLVSAGGHTDHIHLLVRLLPTQDAASVARLIKGESASWANKQGLFDRPFAWATAYYAASVDGEDRVRLNSYFSGQDKRHEQVARVFLESPEGG